MEDVLLLAERYSGRSWPATATDGIATCRRRVRITEGDLATTPAHRRKAACADPDDGAVNWRLVGVLDLGWEKYQVAVEYDADHHRTDRRQYVRDQHRLRKLKAMGWIVIRVIAEDTPEDVIRRVREALATRGYRAFKPLRRHAGTARSGLSLGGQMR